MATKDGTPIKIRIPRVTSDGRVINAVIMRDSLAEFLSRLNRGVGYDDVLGRIIGSFPKSKKAPKAREEPTVVLRDPSQHLINGARMGDVKMCRDAVMADADHIIHLLTYGAHHGNKCVLDYAREIKLLSDVSDWNIVLRHASSGNQMHIVKYALANGANDYDDMLDYAAHGNALEICQLALDLGATQIWPAIRSAIYTDSLKTCAFLYEKLPQKDNSNAEIILKEAAMSGHCDICEYARSLGARDFSVMVDRIWPAIKDIAKKWIAESAPSAVHIIP
jgi:hypothetical protein